MPAAATTPGAVAPTRCQNCGASLCGPYCSACGQRARSRTLSVWHLLQEAIGDIYHLDSRLWLTLRPLLLQPGLLTVEYLAGRRARFVPPFRLYLVVSVFLFVLVWHLPGTAEAPFQASDPASVQRALDLTAAALAQKRAELERAGGNDAERQQIAELELKLQQLRRRKDAPAKSNRFCDEMQVSFLGSASAEARLRQSCHKIVADRGAGLVRAFLDNLPRMMFVFLPILALVNKLLYLRSRRYYVEHLLFFVHLHVFVFLVLSLVVLGNRVLALVPRFHPLAIASAAIWIAVLSYVYLAMRRVYTQGRLKTLVKFGILLFAYTISLGITTVGTVLYSALTL